MFTYFLVSVLHAGRIFVIVQLSKFVQFIEDRVRLLECSPASCQALRNQSEEKREKFITTNHLPLVLTHAGTVSNFEKLARA